MKNQGIEKESTMMLKKLTLHTIYRNISPTNIVHSVVD